MNDERLTLLGQSAEDIPSISALLQDATLRVADIGYGRRSRRLVLLVNRFRWEASTPSRVRCALRIETVFAVQRQNWPQDAGAVLNLLNMASEGDRLVLTFAAGVAVQVQVEVIEVVLEDLATPWATQKVPTHPA